MLLDYIDSLGLYFENVSCSSGPLVYSKLYLFAIRDIFTDVSLPIYFIVVCKLVNFY